MSPLNWSALKNKKLGMMNVLADALAGTEVLLPEFSGPRLVVSSDYSGSHSGSPFEVYSILIGDLALCGEWFQARSRVRNQFLRNDRRMSYKTLNDRQRQRALGPFLAAADLIPGLCVSLAVSKNAGSLFQKDIGPVAKELTACLLWHKNLSERAFRVIHFVSAFVALLSRPGQDVLWFTDEDEIAANEERLTIFTKVWANVLSNYAIHGLGNLRCGTTKCDTGLNDIEDLTAIPDLAAGAVSDLLAPVVGNMHEGIITPLPLNQKMKSTFIGNWLLNQKHRLKKLILTIDRKPDSAELYIGRLRLTQLS
jgi:hypothetical protein